MSEAYRRGLDQMAALVERHLALVELIGAASSWAALASSQWRRRISWLLPMTARVAAKQAWEFVEDDVLTDVLAHCAYRLDVRMLSWGMPLCIGRTGRPQQAIRLWFGSPMRSRVDRRGAAPWSAAAVHVCWPVPRGAAGDVCVEGLPFGMVRRIGRRPHFLVAAAICADGLPEYVRTMEGLCWAAETTLERAYVAAVELTYKGLLEMEVAATRRGQPWATDPIGDWMQALANGGIDAAAREAVLRRLEPAYSDAVAYARQVGNL